MPLPTPFHNASQLRAAFIDGLQPLLDRESLGTFILVCANASFDAAIFPQLSSGLRRQFEQLYARFHTAFASGLPVNEVDEDLLVFLKMSTVGIDALKPTELRREGPWQLQFNHLRSFRPKRISQQAPHGISAPFDEKAFHFNKPFMQKEVFWRGELARRSMDLYYNKYPFADLHTLLVPEREKCLPQYLQRQYHDYIWEVCQQLGAQLPGVGVGYNSYGAFASVNHLHFQMYVGAGHLPVEDACWQHNGGNEVYPSPCHGFSDANEMWQAIADLHRIAIPYTLLYRPGRAFLFPRRPQGEQPPPLWSSGFTWSEMAGAIVTFNREAYAALSEGEISRQLQDAGRAAAD